MEAILNESKGDPVTFNMSQLDAFVKIPGYVDQEEVDLDTYGSLEEIRFRDANENLRFGVPLNGVEKDAVETLKGAMAPLVKDQVVFRGLTPRGEGFSELRTMLEKGNVSAIPLPAFTYTSVYLKHSALFAGRGGIMFNLTVKKGTKAFVSNAGEGEIMLPPGSEVKIKSITKQDVGGYSDILYVKGEVK